MLAVAAPSVGGGLGGAGGVLQPVSKLLMKVAMPAAAPTKENLNGVGLEGFIRWMFGVFSIGDPCGMCKDTLPNVFEKQSLLFVVHIDATYRIRCCPRVVLRAIRH